VPGLLRREVVDIAVGAYHRNGDIGLPELREIPLIMYSPLNLWLNSANQSVVFLYLSAPGEDFFGDAVYMETASLMEADGGLPGCTVADMELLAAHMCRFQATRDQLTREMDEIGRAWECPVEHDLVLPRFAGLPSMGDLEGLLDRHVLARRAREVQSPRFFGVLTDMYLAHGVPDADIQQMRCTGSAIWLGILSAKGYATESVLVWIMPGHRSKWRKLPFLALRCAARPSRIS
jgi:hypothetical protein